MDFVTACANEEGSLADNWPFVHSVYDGTKNRLALRGGDRLSGRITRRAGRLPIECIDMSPFGGEALLHNSIQADRVAGCQMMTYKYIVAMIVELADRLDRAARPSKRLRFLVGGMDERAPVEESGRTQRTPGSSRCPCSRVSGSPISRK